MRGLTFDDNYITDETLNSPDFKNLQFLIDQPFNSTRLTRIRLNQIYAKPGGPDLLKALATADAVKMVTDYHIAFETLAALGAPENISAICNEGVFAIIDAAPRARFFTNKSGKVQKADGDFSEQKAVVLSQHNFMIYSDLIGYLTAEKDITKLVAFTSLESGARSSIITMLESGLLFSEVKDTFDTLYRFAPDDIARNMATIAEEVDIDRIQTRRAITAKIREIYNDSTRGTPVQYVSAPATPATTASGSPRLGSTTPQRQWQAALDPRTPGLTPQRQRQAALDPQTPGFRLPPPVLPFVPSSPAPRQQELDPRARVSSDPAPIEGVLLVTEPPAIDYSAINMFLKEYQELNGKKFTFGMCLPKGYSLDQDTGKINTTDASAGHVGNLLSRSGKNLLTQK